MKFTRQDLLTFLLGLAAAVAVPLGHALITFDADTLDELKLWGAALASGLLAAAGRYIATWVPQVFSKLFGPPGQTPPA